MLRSLVLCAIAAVLLAVAPSAAMAAPDGALAAACGQVDARLAAACYAGDIAVRDAEAACRRAGAGCQPAASEEAIAAYERSSTHRALGLQEALGHDLPLRDATFVGTHNSFNSIAEMGPTLSNTDSNQQLTLVDQLRLGVRSLELDVHWFPSLASGGARAPVVCHAQGNHEGCSIERELRPLADQIAGWSRSHPEAVLLLYVEDHLDGAAGAAAATAALRGAFGPLLHTPPARPAGGGCAPLPLALTRDEVLAAGARVVVVSGCASGGDLAGVAFDWDDRHVESRPQGFRDFPDCGPDFDRATYDATLVRYFEDSTGLTNGGSVIGAAEADDGITPATAAAMARCGVDLTGMDQLLPTDGRLEALVWSWAPGEPRTGDCAVARGSDARWLARRCGKPRRRAACRDAGDGGWSITRRAVRQRDAARACRQAGSRFAVPRTGYENARLRVAARGATVWLGTARAGSGWRALDPR